MLTARPAFACVALVLFFGVLPVEARGLAPAAARASGPDAISWKQVERWFLRAREAWEADELEEARRCYAQAARLPEDTPPVQRAAIDRINYHRGMAMVRPVIPHPKVAAAALAHAAYLGIHGGRGALSLESAHRERRERRGFTGVQLRDRIARQGLQVRGCLEVVSAYSDAVKAVDHLMNTVYHRAGLLREEARWAGFGASSRGVIDLAWEDEGAVWAPFSLYPGPGQVEVSPRFAGGETPEPLPAATYPVGSPLSVGGAREPPSLIAARLEGPEGSCPLRILRRGTAPMAELLGNFVFLVPVQPLRDGTRYEADVTFALEGRKTRRRWSFTTGQDSAGEERWWARITELRHEGHELRPGKLLPLEAVVEASQPEALVLEWWVDGKLQARGKGRSFEWALPSSGAHRIELRASYPETPGAFATRGFSVDFGAQGLSDERLPEKRDGIEGGGLRFHPPPPWAVGDAVRLDADPLLGQGRVDYEFFVDETPLKKASPLQAWWRADGRLAHRFRLRMRFEGGTATRTVDVKAR